MTHNYDRLKEYANELRNNPTHAERKLWYRINRRQILKFRFNRQYIIDSYIVDFFCREAGLVIEIDGGGHFTPEMEAKDKYRDDNLRAKGLHVLRFNNTEVMTNIDGVLNRIYEYLSSL